jgi:hypothetical protein
MSGQAWLPLKGEGSLTLTGQAMFVKDHISWEGIRADSGHIRANSTRLELTYGLTDRLTVSGDMAYIWAKYEFATCPRCVPHGLVDDYSYNGGLQDARINVLYALSSGRIAVTPFMRAVIPLTDYSPQGHSAIGRHLHEVAAGAFAGTHFGPFAPDLYVQAAYMYSVVERVEDISTNRSNGELELGYFVTPALSVRAMGFWQETHGGFDLPKEFHEGEFEIHDRVAKSKYIRFGLGASYALNRATALNAAVINTYSGASTYASRGMSVGVTWNFGRSSDWIH